MSAPHDQPATYPAVPPSLSAGGHEMRDYYTTPDPPRPSPHTAPSITPYLGLRARLSQIWINRWTILLLLVLARTLIAISGLHNDLGSARREVLSACTGVESMGDAMASMPHYMSQGVNELAATGVEKAVNGLMSMMMLTVTGVEEIVVFYINFLTQTYVCLITLAVSGSLHVALQVIEDAGNFLNKTIPALTSEISDSANSFEKDFNSLVSKINGIASLDANLPKLDINGTLQKLDDIQLNATQFDGNLGQLNASIPNFTDVNNFTQHALRLPFETVKGLINDTMTGYHFDRSVLPVPQKEQLTFCSDNNGINDFFDDLVSLANLARRIFIGVLLTAAILVCIPMAWQEIRRWRTMQQRSKLVCQGAYDPMDVVYIVSRPYTSATGIKTANRFKQPRRQILVRWAVAYATSSPALFVLSLALAGLFACACQAILLKAVEKEVPDLTNQVGAFAGKVINSLNNASESWSVGTNKVMDDTNNEINGKLLGWVNTTTGALNDTLNTFVADMTDALNKTFGGTILLDPAMDVINCLIGLKIQGIQKGLTWVSDNAHVDFPRLPNNTFSLGAVASIASNNSNKADSFLADPSGAATDQISSAVTRVTNSIESAIRTEALISTGVLMVWVIIALIGIIRALMLFFSKDKTRGEGGTLYAADPQYSGFNDIPMETRNVPAPKYTATPDVSPFSGDSQDEDTYQDQKLGFAGQRNYETALQREATKGGHSRISSHGEVWDSDRKG